MFELILFQLTTVVTVLALLWHTNMLKRQVAKLKAEKKDMETGLELVAKALRATSAIGYTEAYKQGYFPQLPQASQCIVEDIYKQKVEYKVKKGKENSPFN